MYTATVTPGPGSYDLQTYDGFHSRLANRKGAKKGTGTMGAAGRACMMPHAGPQSFSHRRTHSPRPGPADYSADHNSVMPARATTFDGHYRHGHGCSDTAIAITKLEERLQILNRRYHRVILKLKELDESKPSGEGSGAKDQQAEAKRAEAMRAVQVAEQGKLRKLIKGTKDLLRQAQYSQQDTVNRGSVSSLAAKIKTDRTQPHSFPHNAITDRFFEPRPHTMCFTPSAAEYLSNPLDFGREALSRSPKFSLYPRPTDHDAPHSKSHVSLRLHPGGSAYYGDICPLGPGEYTPNTSEPMI